MSGQAAAMGVKEVKGVIKSLEHGNPPKMPHDAECMKSGQAGGAQKKPITHK